MQFPKIVTDVYDDDAEVTVGAYLGEARVYLEMDRTDMAYTPAQARRLAKALKKAADVAEGNG